MALASLSIIVPAFNEEGNLAAAVHSTTSALKELNADYEILIFDDGSIDRTGEIADHLAKEDSRIRVVHNGTNKGFGYNYRQGVKMARLEFIGMVPGDNEIDPESVKNIFKSAGRTNLVVAYHASPHLRPWIRRLLSCLFTHTINFAFGLNLKYYNGPNIIKKDLLKMTPMSTDSFAYMAEILIHLTLNKGESYAQVGFKLKPRAYGHSKALHLSNLAKVALFMLSLWLDTFVRHKKGIQQT